MKRVELDDTSKRILSLLQEDGRMSYAAIAQQVNLSEAAVRHRVGKLVENNVVQIVGVTDPMQMGFARQAMIGIRVNDDARRVAARLAEVPEIGYVVITSGRFDLLVEVVVESDEKLLMIVSEHITGAKDISGSETFTYLKLQKQTYSWGVR